MLNQVKRTSLNGNQVGSMSAPRKAAVKKAAKRLKSQDAFRLLNGLFLRENAITRRGQKPTPTSHRNGPHIRQNGAHECPDQ